MNHVLRPNGAPRPPHPNRLIAGLLSLRHPLPAGVYIVRIQQRRGVIGVITADRPLAHVQRPREQRLRLIEPPASRRKRSQVLYLLATSPPSGTASAAPAAYVRSTAGPCRSPSPHKPSGRCCSQSWRSQIPGTHRRRGLAEPALQSPHQPRSFRSRTAAEPSATIACRISPAWRYSPAMKWATASSRNAVTD